MAEIECLRTRCVSVSSLQFRSQFNVIHHFCIGIRAMSTTMYRHTSRFRWRFSGWSENNNDFSINAQEKAATRGGPRGGTTILSAFLVLPTNPGDPPSDGVAPYSWLGVSEPCFLQPPYSWLGVSEPHFATHRLRALQRCDRRGGAQIAPRWSVVAARRRVVSHPL
jgi:hypothetical protein